MNVKIQGGGNGKYSNKGSSYGIVSYLEHEDLSRMNEGLFVEPFFNQNGSSNFAEIVKDLDSNKAKLSKNDSKFYVITVSPNENEIKSMGNTLKERSENFKNYIKNDVMKIYAENFNKNLTQIDIKYYAKIHHSRNNLNKENMHAHIIVSRKDMSNKIKISPQTNHKETNKGVVKGGFNRTSFFEKIENGFDQRFDYNRLYEEKFTYQNTMKNGTLEQIQEQIKESLKSNNLKIEHSKIKNKYKGIER